MGKATRSEDQLTLKQQTFVAEVIKSGNAAEAYRIAYPDYKGRHADAKASDLMGMPKIRAAVEKYGKEIKKKAIAQSGEIQEHMTVILRDKTGKHRAHERIRSAEVLGKIQKLFSERREFTGKVEHDHTHTVKLPTREEATAALAAELERNPALRAQLRELLAKYE